MRTEHKAQDKEPWPVGAGADKAAPGQGAVGHLAHRAIGDSNVEKICINNNPW